MLMVWGAFNRMVKSDCSNKEAGSGRSTTQGGSQKACLLKIRDTSVGILSNFKC